MDSSPSLSPIHWSAPSPVGSKPPCPDTTSGIWLIPGVHKTDIKQTRPGWACRVSFCDHPKFPDEGTSQFFVLDPIQRQWPVRITSCTRHSQNAGNFFSTHYNNCILDLKKTSWAITQNRCAYQKKFAHSKIAKSQHFCPYHHRSRYLIVLRVWFNLLLLIIVLQSKMTGYC